MRILDEIDGGTCIIQRCIKITHQILGKITGPDSRTHLFFDSPYESHIIHVCFFSVNQTLCGWCCLLLLLFLISKLIPPNQLTLLSGCLGITFLLQLISYRYQIKSIFIYMALFTQKSISKCLTEINKQQQKKIYIYHIHTYFAVILKCSHHKICNSCQRH